MGPCSSSWCRQPGSWIKVDLSENSFATARFPSPRRRDCAVLQLSALRHCGLCLGVSLQTSRTWMVLHRR
jgi:hypothetical protein